MSRYFRKRWGQHFLSDKNLLQKLIRIVNPQPEDSILEIGPGEGALTELLIPRVKELMGIEIDHDLYNSLLSNEALAGCMFIREDFLQVDLSTLPFTGSQIRVVGNIPYHITSPIIFKLLEHSLKWHDIHLTVQKEVADRMTAQVASKAYGRLTVMIGVFMDVRQELVIPPDVFIPKPRVDSAMVSLKAHRRFHLTQHVESVFRDIVRVAFSHRRKMLKNSLNKLFPDLNIIPSFDFSRRPETLSVDEFIDLAFRFSSGE